MVFGSGYLWTLLPEGSFFGSEWGGTSQKNEKKQDEITAILILRITKWVDSEHAWF